MAVTDISAAIANVISAHEAISNAVSSSAETHAAMLESSREESQRRQVIAEGIAAHNASIQAAR